MIHYNHNTGVYKNIRLNKAKRHAVAHYRHKQRITTIKDTLTRLAIVLTVSIALSIVYLVVN